MKKQILAPSILALFVASAAHAGATFDTAAGSLYLGGDVEFDYTTVGGQTADVNNLEYVSADSTVTASGRLLVDIHGEHAIENGNFVAFKVNPTFTPDDGGTGVDDAWIQIGTKNDWNIKAGHFEATDLSVAGQDTYIASIGTATMYRANDARGRTDDDNAAQVTFTKSLTDTTAFEVTAQSQDSGDVIIARPLVTYSADSVSLAVGAEVPVQDHNDNQDWVGFGATTTIQATDDLAVTLRAAYKTGDQALSPTVYNTTYYLEGDAMTVGIGAQYQNFYAAVLYGEDSYDELDIDAEEMQVYASYKIPAVMDIDNFDIYLAASYAEGEVEGEEADDVIGARIRLKYIF